MATKKKPKVKQNRSKKTAKPKSVTSSKKAVTRKGTSGNRLAKKKSTPKKPSAKTKPSAKQKAPVKNQTSRLNSRSAAERRLPKKLPREADVTLLPPGSESDSDAAGQSGDLQGLSNLESADSESVDELIEEGNAFEAGVISGVEEAGDRGEREVRTREVLEDDVPSEYLDEQ